MISIRPEVAMYSAFARLNYKPWFALAEFVDNSVQSYLANKDRLLEAEGPDYRLLIEISIGDDAIEIRDNAAGIHDTEYARAFVPACPPPDTSGLSEFGLGMKAAASWFARKWFVRSTALGESVRRAIEFNVPEIVERNTNELEVLETSCESSDHWTVIRLASLNVVPRGRTLTKIRDHLASIYRVFLRSGEVVLRMNGTEVLYQEPDLLIAPPFREPEAEPVLWKKEINLKLDDVHRIAGWAGILAKGSTTNAGFSLFRRGRLVQGSAGEGYRPEQIFRHSNSYTYQRLVGELDVHGFSVSHTKDGLQWSDWEDDILTWIKAELDREPRRLLQQAEGYRARRRDSDSKDVSVRQAIRDTSDAITYRVPPVADLQIRKVPDESPLGIALDTASEESQSRSRIEVQYGGRTWRVMLELVAADEMDPWLELASAESSDTVTALEMRLNLSHPFMVRFSTADGHELMPITRLATGLAIAEYTARHVGVRQAGTIRRNLNELLREALSGPLAEGESL